ncbi:ANTAR domain-containing protein [Rhodococcus sp. D-46]|nr:ANTAR domain-containing protein [Rhodococcus sp. (in: high G+C Gram-positive bacteria)]MCE4162447.1 ANTAR domain-containing protein [Rhodococcus sp. Ni2]NHE64263.1 ANTAR domain-containing protein [Rhodococcus sp. D-46]
MRRSNRRRTLAARQRRHHRQHVPLGRPYRRRRLTLTPSERNFERALDSRAVIDQAKGVLMAVHGVDADGAFAMLVETSRRTNTKVRVVAEELLASVRIT